MDGHIRPDNLFEQEREIYDEVKDRKTAAEAVNDELTELLDNLKDDLNLSDRIREKLGGIYGQKLNQKIHNESMVANLEDIDTIDQAFESDEILGKIEETREALDNLEFYVDQALQEGVHSNKIREAQDKILEAVAYGYDYNVDKLGRRLKNGENLKM